MCAARVNDKKPIRCSVHPNPVLLQIFFVNTERIIGWISNLEDGSRFKEHTRQEESEERDEPCRKKSNYATPNKSAAPPVRDGVRRSHGRHARCGCCFRGPDCRGADVLGGVGTGDRFICGRHERLLSRLAFSLHVFHHCFVRHPLALSTFGPDNLDGSTTGIRYPARRDIAVAGIGVLVDKLAPIFSSSSP